MVFRLRNGGKWLVVFMLLFESCWLFREIEIELEIICCRASHKSNANSESR
jgi:hypothetical protein